MTESDRVEAGELALGVLDGDERAAALRRVLAEPDFAAEVTRWRRQLAGLAVGYPEVAPADAVEREIVTRLRPERRRQVGVWRGLAVAASAIAASLALILALPRHPRPVAVPAPPARVLVAALAGKGGKPYAAVYDEHAARVSLVGAAPWAADRSAELWAIAPGKPPSALGLLTRGERSVVALAPRARGAMAAGVTLAVSIEPAGGSPTGLPTGPVVASGGLVAG